MSRIQPHHSILFAIVNIFLLKSGPLTISSNKRDGIDKTPGGGICPSLSHTGVKAEFLIAIYTCQFWLTSRPFCHEVTKPLLSSLSPKQIMITQLFDHPVSSSLSILLIHPSSLCMTTQGGILFVYSINSKALPH